jgi:hypothetical protein
MKNQSQSISNFLLCLFSFSSSNQNIKASLSSFYIKPAAAAAFSCDSLITDWLTWESMCVLLVLSYLHTYEHICMYARADLGAARNPTKLF